MVPGHSTEWKLAHLSCGFVRMCPSTLLAGLMAFPGGAWELVWDSFSGRVGWLCPGLEGKAG